MSSSEAVFHQRPKASQKARLIAATKPIRIERMRYSGMISSGPVFTWLIAIVKVKNNITILEIWANTRAVRGFSKFTALKITEYELCEVCIPKNIIIRERRRWGRYSSTLFKKFSNSLYPANSTDFLKNNKNTKTARYFPIALEIGSLPIRVECHKNLWISFSIPVTRKIQSIR